MIYFFFFLDFPSSVSSLSALRFPALLGVAESFLFSLLVPFLFFFSAFSFSSISLFSRSVNIKKKIEFSFQSKKIKTEVKKKRKIEFLVKLEFLGSKLDFWSRLKFWVKIEFLGQNWNFWIKIQTWVKMEYFVEIEFLGANRIFWF